MFTRTSLIRGAAVCGAGLVVGGLAAGFAAPMAVAGTPTSATVSYRTPGSYTYSVPAGVNSLQLSAAGAGGHKAHGHYTALGGAGTLVQGTLPVTPGQSITIMVGGSDGTGGWGTGGHGRVGDNGGQKGGNGGSASAVVAGGNQIVAGAGGGAGGDSAPTNVGQESGVAEIGGAGGGSATSLNGLPGQGQLAWNARAGVGGDQSGANGSHGNAAPGKPFGDFGGGGGGGGAGWQGGRGGGAGNGSFFDVIGGGGGGAGSSYTAPDLSGVTVHTGANKGNGYVKIVTVASSPSVTASTMQATEVRTLNTQL